MSNPATMHHHAHGPANRRRRVLRTAAPLFVRHPRWRPRAAVVVLHDVHGLTAMTEDRCRQLAQCGYLAIAPYLYYQTGGREFPPEHEETARVAAALLDADDVVAGVAGALDHLHRRLNIPASSTAVLGSGTGGYLASWAAANYALGAAVALHPDGDDLAPWPSMPDLAQVLRRLRTPWLAVAGPDIPRAASEAASSCENAKVLATSTERTGADRWGEAVDFLRSHTS